MIKIRIIKYYNYTSDQLCSNTGYSPNITFIITISIPNHFWTHKIGSANIMMKYNFILPSITTTLDLRIDHISTGTEINKFDCELRSQHDIFRFQISMNDSLLMDILYSFAERSEIIFYKRSIKNSKLLTLCP